MFGVDNVQNIQKDFQQQIVNAQIQLQQYQKELNTNQNNLMGQLNQDLQNYKTQLLNALQ